MLCSALLRRLGLVLLSCVVATDLLNSLIGNGVAAAELSALAKICSTTSAVGKERFQDVLAQASMASSQERNLLLETLRDKNNGCRKELEIRLQELKDKPSNFKNNTGRHAALNLGLMLDLPVALQLVEAEAATSGAPEWLSMLSQWDERSYSTLLRSWVLSSAEKLRGRMGLPKATSELYGKSQIEERVQQGEKSVLTPLVLELYLKDVLTKPSVTVDEFAALNIHYAAGNAGSRRLFGENYIVLLKRNAAQWIPVFREERPWTQFQMIDLMGRVGGSEMIRELLWISQNHADTRMKSRASQALDAALKMR
ncbi:MAG: hypothetical protein FJY29_10930 [Betaproteobacteria bacterium]|nr:hypothetical protein [Betaproteobacteria bacterium]